SEGADSQTLHSSSLNRSTSASIVERGFDMTCGLRFAVGVVAIAVVAAADAAHAQVQEERPRLVLQTGGAIGAIRALDFSPDSTRLYSAGMDKQTQVWGIQPATENAPL